MRPGCRVQCSRSRWKVDPFDLLPGARTPIKECQRKSRPMTPPRSDRTPLARSRRHAAGASIHRKSAGDIGLDRIESAVDALVASNQGRNLDQALNPGCVERLGGAAAVIDGPRNAHANARDSIAEHPEYRLLKRKYRRAQHDADQLRQELVEMQRELAALKSRTIGSQMSAILRARFQSLLNRLPGIATRKVRARHLRDIATIQASGLFDANWYLRNYPDIAAAGVDPIRHYIAKGWKEARDPGPDFNSSGYLKANKDVAKSGMNPLLHYIEFGMSEGRSVGVGARPKIVRSAEVFDPPAPVTQFPLEQHSPIRWKRVHMLDRMKADPVTIGGQVVGSSCANEAALRPVLNRLEQLTGRAVALAGPMDGGHQPEGDAGLPLLCDAWFIREATLRLHCGGRPAAALVIRALQWHGSGGLRAVGERLIAAPSELVDLELATPLNPVLLVFATLQGVIVGSELLAFPSLCRGGLHYAERGALERSGIVAARSDVLACSRVMEEAWARLAGGDATPFLRDIRINLEGSDGTGPLLRKDVRAWLADIFAVDLVSPELPGDASSRAEAYLSASASTAERNSAPTLRNAAPARLVLSHDFMPTLQLLAAPSAPGGAADVVRPASFITACDDTAAGALAAVLPSDGEFQPVPDVTCGDPFWPILAGAVAPDSLIAGIRREPNPPARGQLLEPVGRSVPISGQDRLAEKITLLLEPDAWDQQAWSACLLGLQQQVDAGLAEVCCYGPGAAAFVDEIERVLGVPSRAAPDWTAAVQGCNAPFVLHVGKSIVLHDPRTIRHLAQLLVDGNDGASCPLLACSSHARDWTVTIRSAGCIITPEGEADFAPDVTCFWNTQVPVARLPAEFWIVRAAQLQGETARPARLVLSTRVSASHLATQDNEESGLSSSIESRTNSLQISRWLG